MIKATNLTVKYKDFTAVESISFDVAKGEIFGIIGPKAQVKHQQLSVWKG